MFSRNSLKTRGRAAPDIAVSGDRVWCSTTGAYGYHVRVTDERRGGERHLAWFPIRVEGDDFDEGMAIAKNISRGGLLLASPQKLVIGAPVRLALHLDPESGKAREVEGTIVRMETNEEDPDGMFPHRMGVEFDDPDPELLAEILAMAYSNEEDKGNQENEGDE